MVLSNSYTCLVEKHFQYKFTDPFTGLKLGLSDTIPAVILRQEIDRFLFSLQNRPEKPVLAKRVLETTENYPQAKKSKPELQHIDCSPDKSSEKPPALLCDLTQEPEPKAKKRGKMPSLQLSPEVIDLTL